MVTKMKRRFIGIRLGGKTVTAIYAKPITAADGEILEVVEYEVLCADDFAKVKVGNPAVIKALFDFTLQALTVPYNEIVRLIELRKKS